MDLQFAAFVLLPFAVAVLILQEVAWRRNHEYVTVGNATRPMEDFMATTKTQDPTVVLMFQHPERAERFFYTIDERGEVIETVSYDGRERPDWDEGGICDHRGMGGPDGFKRLHEALVAAEANAKAIGLEVHRLAI